MSGKFIVYALLVSLVCTILSWGELTDGSSRSGSGSTWSSNSGSGGSWGGGGHK